MTTSAVIFSLKKVVAPKDLFYVITKNKRGALQRLSQRI